MEKPHLWQARLRQEREAGFAVHVGLARAEAAGEAGLPEGPCMTIVARGRRCG